ATGHERRTHLRRRPALPERLGRGPARRTDCAGAARPVGPPFAIAVHESSEPQVPAFDIAAYELTARGTARRRGGTLAQGHALGPSSTRAPVLRPGQSTHALGTE